MALNPMKLAQLKPLWNKFKDRHGDFVEDVKTAGLEGLKEGAELRILFVAPDGQERMAKATVLPEDMDLFETIKSLF